MRFYTKEWYALMQITGLLGAYKEIEDKLYSKEDIKALYEQELKKEIERDEKLYNTEPRLYIPKDLYIEPFDPMAWSYVDEEEVLHVPDCPAAVEKELIEHHKVELERYVHRQPFDPAETIACFLEGYRYGIQSAYKGPLSELYQDVPAKLLALGYMPKTPLKAYKKAVKDARRRWNQINKEAENVLAGQDIPEAVRRLFMIHDACLLSMRKKGKDIIMDYRLCGEESVDEYLYCRNGNYLEKDKGISTRKSFDAYGVWTSSGFLYPELYKTDMGYEVHMLFWVGENLAYVTISCSDIKGTDYKTFQEMHHG